MSDTLRFGSLTARRIAESARAHGTPQYLYDESLLRARCREIASMPNAFGLAPRFAMKANSSKAILQLVAEEGFGIDASSLNEARRARAAGIACDRIMLTTQEVPLGGDRKDLEGMMRTGLCYNVCSPRQLSLVADFAASRKIPLSMRIHPGVGSGESSTRNTGDKYSCFGVHLSELDAAMRLAREKSILIDSVHVHIGSGGDPAKWKENATRRLLSW